MPQISVPGILSQDQLPSLALGGYGELLLGVPRPHPLPSLLSVCVQAHLVTLVSPKSMLSEGRYREPCIHSFIHSFVSHSGDPPSTQCGSSGLEDESSLRAASVQRGSRFDSVNRGLGPCVSWGLRWWHVGAPLGLGTSKATRTSGLPPDSSA